MSETLPRLRPEVRVLSWTRPVSARERHFARDLSSGDVLELGAESAFICRFLDGRKSVAELRRDYEKKFGMPLNVEDLEVVLQQLAEAGYLEGAAAGPRKKSFPELFSVGMLMDLIPWGRLRLGEGDRFFGLLSRWSGWAFTRPFHVAAAAAILWAAKITYVDWPEYFLSVERMFSPVFVLMNVLIAALVIRSPRAFVHAIQCKRYRMRVTEVGIAFALYLVPAFYVDWSDAVYIRRKKERDRVIVAGLYYHLLLWAVATIAWRLSHAGSAPNTAWLMVSFVAGFTFLLISANPLAEAEGYLLLMNWLKEPRLRERSLATFGSWITLRQPPEVLSPRERRWLPAYGLLCFAYAIFFAGWMAWYFWRCMSGAFQGAGALLVLAFVMFVAQKPLVESMARRRSVRWLFRKDGGALRWSVRLVIVALLVLIGFIPYPYETGGPFTLLPIQQTEVHTQIEGEVVKVLVKEGELVAQGQALAVVDPREYARNYAATSEQLAAAQAKLDLALAGPKVESVVTSERKLQQAIQEVELARVRYESSSARATRYERAFADRLVSAQEYENARSVRDSDRQTLRVAREAHKVAQAELDLVKSGTRPEEIDGLKAEVRSLQALSDDLKKQIEMTELRAPVAGRVVTPYVDQTVGHYLKTGDLFAKIEEARTIRAEVEVPEEDAPQVKQGARVRVVPWAYPSETFYGSVVSVAPSATENVRSTVVRVLTEIPNTDGRLKSNLTGYAKIATRDEPLWRVLLWPLIRWIMVEVWYWIP